MVMSPCVGKQSGVPLHGESISSFIEDMFETVKQAKGIGLAAPQVDKSWRLFVVDTSPLGKRIKLCKKAFINPEIVEKSNIIKEEEEGCLSIPSIRHDICRSQHITIKYYDENWKAHTEKYEGIAARVILHEYDHLEGALFIDYIKGLTKQVIKSRLKNISLGKVKVDYLIKLKDKVNA